MKSRVVAQTSALEKTKTIWDLCLLIALNKEFGFGNARLERFTKALWKTQEYFTEIATGTDKKKDSYSDIDTAIYQLIEAADSRKIDWREILGIEVISL